jgi:Domain of unknown function (DUF1995)
MRQQSIYYKRNELKSYLARTSVSIDQFIPILLLVLSSYVSVRDYNLLAIAWSPTHIQSFSPLSSTSKYRTKTTRPIDSSNHFQSLCTTRRSTRNDDKTTSTSLFMISNLFGGTTKQQQAVPSLPRDVKEAVAKCRQATQAALQNRISRMDIDFPVGTKFGIEKSKNSKAKRNLNINENKPTKIDFDRSDRELARIFVEMFQPVGNDRIVVAFKDMESADNAKLQWKDDVGNCGQVMSLDRRKSSAARKKLKKEQKSKPNFFAAKMAAEIESNDDTTTSETAGPFQLPDNTEVAIFVAPGQTELPIIEKICQSVGMGTLVILLNARKHSSITNFGSAGAAKLFQEEFVSVFHLGSASQDVAPGCLLYHAYDSNGTTNESAPWILARKPTIGQPKTILVTSPSPPTIDECKVAYETSVEGLSDMERNVENALENVANWLR